VQQVVYAFGHNCVHVYKRNLYTRKLPLSRGYSSLKGSKSPNWCCFLASSIHFTTQNSNVLISTTWTSLVIMLVIVLLIKLWSLLTFGCDGWDFGLHWQSLILDWGLIRPQNVYNFFLVFTFGFATMSLMSLFFLPFHPRSHILHWFFWWVLVRLT